MEIAAAGAEVVSGLHLLGAGDDAGAVVLAPLADLAVAEAELAQAAHEAGRNFLQGQQRGSAVFYAGQESIL
jgi:hypothetical protein